jgi:hypothetical protein
MQLGQRSPGSKHPAIAEEGAVANPLTASTTANVLKFSMGNPFASR